VRANIYPLILKECRKQVLQHEEMQINAMMQLLIEGNIYVTHLDYPLANTKAQSALVPIAGICPTSESRGN
jgi:hypothetical protein